MAGDTPEEGEKWSDEGNFHTHALARDLVPFACNVSCIFAGGPVRVSVTFCLPCYRKRHKSRTYEKNFLVKVNYGGFVPYNIMRSLCAPYC